MTRRLLLLSNSQSHGQGYLDHAAAEIEAFLGDRRLLAFLPFALKDQAGYGAKVAERLAALGITTSTATPDETGRSLIEGTQAVFVGGGNTFRLLDLAQRSGILDILKRRTAEGLPYMGSSAGTNLVCPTIRTTNDMPIVQPASFEAIGAIPFQINPHYLDAAPDSTHMGETREQRLLEFHEENDVAVLGLREGTWLRVEGDAADLGGAAGARIFRRGQEPEERPAGASVADLLRG